MRTTAIVVAKVAVIVVVTIAAFGHVDSANWSPFIPENTGHFGAYGWSGVFQGTAIVFFAYMGFDAVSTLGQEARDPQRTIPRSLIGSLVICAVLYVGVSLAATGLMDYRQLNVPDPLYRALDAAAGALAWAKPLVGFVAVFGLISVLFAALIGQSRIFYSMGRDGLLPASFARVHSSTGVPLVGTLVTAGIAMFAAGWLPLGLLSELISIGTLLAFGLVCVGVIVLRIVQPEVPRSFHVPWVPFIPICGALACAYVMWTLPLGTWLRDHGEMLITQRLACGRDRSSQIAMRSDRAPPVDRQSYRIARRASGH